MERDWLDRLTHCFLIREPGEMLTSLIHQLPEPTLADTGLPQQVAIFELARQRTGRVPPVIDARDVLEDPEGVLRALCAAVGVGFIPRMLEWPPGRRETDGVWAEHWYAAVERSTSFKPYGPKSESLPEGLKDLHAECAKHYRLLHEHRLKPVSR